MCTNICCSHRSTAHFLIFRSNVSAEDRWRNVQVVQQCCYESAIPKSCHSGDVRWRRGVSGLKLLKNSQVFFFADSSRMKGPLVKHFSDSGSFWVFVQNVDYFDMKSLLVYIVYMMWQLLQHLDPLRVEFHSPFFCVCWFLLVWRIVQERRGENGPNLWLIPDPSVSIFFAEGLSFSQQRRCLWRGGGTKNVNGMLLWWGFHGPSLGCITFRVCWWRGWNRWSLM